MAIHHTEFTLLLSLQIMFLHKILDDDDEVTAQINVAVLTRYD